MKTRTMRRLRGPVAGVVALALAIPAASAAAPDPERDSTVPTSWHWYDNVSGAELKALGTSSGERVIDIHVEKTSPVRFAAVLVHNSGAYQRDGASWWYGLSWSALQAKVKARNGRITDLEPYTVNGERRFAFTMVRNTGPAAKSWWTDYDLTSKEVTAGVKNHNLRLIDLDQYKVGSKTRYSYVGIRNTGADQRAWWLYFNATPDFIAKERESNGARLTRIERPSPGHLTVLMEKRSGIYDGYGYGLDKQHLMEAYAGHGLRITDLEAYTVDGERRFAFTGIDNANPETARLRKLSDRMFNNTADFGKRVWRGFYLKQVGGPVLASLAARVPYQPFSVLKLLPYTYALESIHLGRTIHNQTETLKSQVTWTGKDGDEFAPCLTPGSPGTHQGAAPIYEALPLMMWASHNRTTDSFVERYTPQVFTARAQDAWGMPSTRAHYGCPLPGNDKPWKDNRTTLADIGNLYEGVTNGSVLGDGSERDAFNDLMTTLDYEGKGFRSRITQECYPYPNDCNRKATNGYLRPIVQQEAGKDRAGNVESFLRYVSVRSKGGNGGPDPNNQGYAESTVVTVPFKVLGVTVLKHFVTGWFVNRIHSPSGCPDPHKGGATCDAIWHSSLDAMADNPDSLSLKRQLYAAAFRMAMKTWPKNP